MEIPSENWKKVISKDYKEQIFEKLFIDYSTKKGLAKKFDKSKNTVKKYLLELEKAGYIEKEKSIYTTGKRTQEAQRTNLKAFFDYWESQGLTLTRTDKELIQFIFTSKEIRKVAMELNERDVFHKITTFLLVFCKHSIEITNYDILRCKYKNFMQIIRHYQSCEEEPIRRLNQNNLEMSLNKIQSHLPFHFILKVFQLTIPYDLAQDLFQYPMKFLENMRIYMDSPEFKKTYSLKIRPSKKEINLLFKEWEFYKKKSIVELKI